MYVSLRKIISPFFLVGLFLYFLPSLLHTHETLQLCLTRIKMTISNCIQIMKELVMIWFSVVAAVCMGI